MSSLDYKYVVAISRSGWTPYDFTFTFNFISDAAEFIRNCINSSDFKLNISLHVTVVSEDQ